MHVALAAAARPQAPRATRSGLRLANLCRVSCCAVARWPAQRTTWRFIGADAAFMIAAVLGLLRRWPFHRLRGEASPCCTPLFRTWAQHWCCPDQRRGRDGLRRLRSVRDHVYCITRVACQPTSRSVRTKPRMSEHLKRPKKKVSIVPRLSKK